MIDFSKLPSISLQLFMKLLQTFDVENLRKIPVEKLPDSIPEHFAEHLPEDKKRFLDDYNMAKQMARLKDYNANIDLMGKDVADIVEQIKSNRLVNQTTYFVEKVALLEKVANDHKLQKCQTIPPIKLLKLSDTLHNMLTEIRDEYVVAIKYVPVIKKNYSHGGGVGDKLKKVMAQLKKQLIPVHKTIISYYKIRLAINLCEMRHLKLKILQTEGEITNIDEQIRDLAIQMEKFKSLWSKVAHKSEEVVTMQDQMNDLFQMRKQLEVPIDEHRLTRWLDSVVDVFVGPGTEELAKSKYAEHAKKMIFFLLVKYCEQQEAAARDVAENPFIVVNAEKAIDFLLSSEQFILHYFERKRKEMAAWLGNVVTDKQSALEDIKKTLLVEMKKNIKYVR